ncbi:MAG: hypothetical protein E6H07_13255 [Bacteroidetes bacterium]|nr:MAG: hypothetical protein E6H07_13255 [Bacteroidota bacterium]
MKRQFAALIALMVILSASAFTLIDKNENAKKDTTYFYRLKAGGDPLEEADYTTKYTQAPDPCTGDDYVCWIEAEDNGSNQPEITGAMVTEIGNALFYHTNTDHVILKD